MSITPVDKPPDGNDESDETPSIRFWSLRAGLDRLFSWILDRVGSIEFHLEPREPRDRAPVADFDRPTVEGGDAGACGTIDGFSNRERPLTYPGRELSGINTPDVVSLETEDGLRLSVPENPDAQLTSDVWTTVDP